jgi:hypothetical protein
VCYPYCVYCASPTELGPQPAGGGKKERQRLRKIEEALEVLRGAMELMEETVGARGVDAVEAAMQAAAKHEARSESLAALMVVARDLVEQARAAEAERVRVAAEEAVAAAAVKAVAEAEAAVKRQQLEERLAALALEVRQVQAELGSGSGTPQPDAEETTCVVCMDAAKDQAVRPCMHVCVCETCAQLLMLERGRLGALCAVSPSSGCSCSSL